MKCELSDFQRGNLHRLAVYLWDLPQAVFDMADYSVDGHSPSEGCGTIGCAVGYGPNAGIAANNGDTDWIYYLERVFISHAQDPDEQLWSWCFSDEWAEKDNSPRGAACRILYMLRYGLPDDWEDQLYEDDAPLCYLNEPLDSTTPADRQRLGFVVPCLSQAVAQ